MTHGGLLSLHETIYHKTPLVGVPFGNDQTPNLLRAQKNGYGKMLTWDSVTEESLLEAIYDALTNETMIEAMETAHKIFVDAKETPLEKAVWWIGYALRYPGAEHLKPASLSLSWYEYHLLDVILFLTSVLALLLLISISICYLGFKCCCKLCRTKETKTKEE